MKNLFGITLGDSSGIGPEILLKAFREGQLRHPVVVYGDFEALAYYSDLLQYDVQCDESSMSPIMLPASSTCSTPGCLREQT
jgi:4-hydroxy-L-threonine phosphate dehydrogenase PdxA